MKKLLLVLVITLFIGVLLASPMDEINDWTAKQTDNFDADDVVTFLNGSRAEGDITYGPEYVYNPVSSQFNSTTTLDTNHFVVVYSDVGNSNSGTAIVGTVSGNNISYGSEFVFNYGGTYFIKTATLDSNHFVIVYQDYGNSNFGTAIVGTVSGSNISFGSESVFNATITYCYPTTLDANHFVVVYRDSDNNSYGTSIMGTVSGNNISFGSEFVFNSAGSYSYLSAITLDATHFVVAYRNSANSYYGTTVVGSISGNDISYGSEFVFNHASSQFINVTALDTNHFVVVYIDMGNSNSSTAIVGTVSGYNISYGSEFVYNSAITYGSVATLGATQFIIVGQNEGNSNYGTAIVGIVSGSNISYGSEFVFNSADTSEISVTILDATHFVFVYRDNGNSNYGTAIVGEIENPLPAVTFTDGTGYSPGSLTPGQNTQPFGRFTLQASASGGTITAADIKLTGTRTAGQVSNIELWYSSDATFGGDTQLGATVGTDPGTDGTASFSGFNQSIGTSAGYYFISCDVSAGASGAIHGVIVNNNDLIFSGAVLSSSISNAYLSGGDVALPVNLSAFYALYIGSTPTLYWTTQSEGNNAYWNVYRGTSDNFETASIINASDPVPGNGTTTNASDYIYVDTLPVIQNTTYWYWI